jgi:hypothetical protein
MEGGVVFKVRSTRDIFSPKWQVNTKVDPSKLDPNLKVIISQCDIKIIIKLQCLIYNYNDFMAIR